MKMKRTNENNLGESQYLITARCGKSLVYLSIDNDNNTAIWTRNMARATIWYNDIDRIYMDCISWVQKAMESTKEEIVYATMMIQKIEYSLFPIDMLMTMKVSENMDNITVDKLINSGISYTGRELELWCIKNIKTITEASVLYNKYFNREEMKKVENVYPPNSRVHYYVIKDSEGNYSLHRDYEKSGSFKKPGFKKYKL